MGWIVSEAGNLAETMATMSTRTRQTTDQTRALDKDIDALWAEIQAMRGDIDMFLETIRKPLADQSGR